MRSVRKVNFAMSSFEELCCNDCSSTKPFVIQLSTQHGSAAQRMLFKNCRTHVILRAGNWLQCLGSQLTQCILKIIVDWRTGGHAG